MFWNVHSLLVWAKNVLQPPHKETFQLLYIQQVILKTIMSQCLENDGKGKLLKLFQNKIKISINCDKVK